MKKLWDWVKNVWVYSGLSKENYENIQQSVAHKNARLLKNAIRSFEVLTGVLLIAAFFFSQLNALKSFLILTFIGMMMMEIIVRVCDLNNFRSENRAKKMLGLMMRERNILSQVLEMEIFLIKNGRRYIIVILTQRRIKKRLITY